MVTSRVQPEASSREAWQPPVWLVAVVMLVAVGPLFGPVPRWLDGRYGIDDAASYLVLAFTVVLTLIVAAVVALRAAQVGLRKTLEQVGFVRSTSRKAVIVGLVVGVLWGLLGLFGIYQFEDDPDFSITATVIGVRLLGFAIGLVEDVITRGFVMNSLQDSGRSNRVQLLISAGLFAAYHSVWMGTAAAVGTFIFSLIYGLILSGLFLWGGRSLWPVALAHSVALLIGEPFLTQSLIYSLR